MRTAVAAFLIASLALLACSGNKPATKVILVGIDAADWAIARPLIDQGKMPNLARLVREGATGDLATLQPLQKSPIIWTSIATGVYPDKHGIGGFLTRTARGDSVPYTGNVRMVRAIWDILGERGIKVGVVGWLVTWPAEPVNGYLVTDYIQYENEKGIKPDRQTYPESLFAEVDRLRLAEKDVSDGAITGILPAGALSDTAGASWEKGYVKMCYATDETFRRVALDLQKKGVEFLAVYFNGVDSMCHAFWGSRGQAGSPVAGLIDGYYVWIDQVLGEFMRLADDRTLVVVCSDHGFHGPRYAEDGSLELGVSMHGSNGVIGLVGPGVRKGARLPDADVLDVTPTILYALGLPTARDMDGGVLTDAFSTGFLKSNPVTVIPTYETTPRKPGEPVPSPVDQEVKRKLKALGYIQ